MEHSITSLTSSSPTPDIKNQASARNSTQFYSGSYAYMETHKDNILCYASHKNFSNSIYHRDFFTSWCYTRD